MDCGENAAVVVVHAVLDIDPNEPSNITVFFAVEWTHAYPQSFRVNNIAPRNMESMLVTLDTSQREMSQLNEIADRNISGILVTLETSHYEMSLLNAFAQCSIPDMSLTFDTSHFEMSPRNNFSVENNCLMSVTFDTSHSLIRPCRWVGQLPFGNNVMHAFTALLSSTLDRGKNATRAGGVCVCVCVCV